jgi:CheY-like chemotaxis protein
VILVDDDIDTREMYGWSLEARGFEVLSAGSAAAGFRLTEEHHPDVVVTDFTLPGEDGFVLAQRIRAQRAIGDTPMVLVSGRAFVADSGERASQLFDRLLLKPVLPDQLIAEMVPLMLDRTAARLERQLTDVRARVRPVPRTSDIPHTSDVGRILAAVTEVAPNGDPPAALLANTAARYIAVNDAACTLTGRSREELLSLRVWDLTPDAGVADGQQQWARFVASGTLTGAYVLRTTKGNVPARFAASAHVLPDCHLSLIQSVPPALADQDLRG